MTYAEKLKDPRWQKKRLEVLQRDDFTCKLCWDSKTTLHVHHKSYHGDPWETPSEELVTYCEYCHTITRFSGEGVEILRVNKVLMRNKKSAFITLVCNDTVGDVGCFLIIGEMKSPSDYITNSVYLFKEDLGVLKEFIDLATAKNGVL